MILGWTLRDVGARLTVLLGASLMLWVGHQHYPLGEWLLWRYAGYWLIGLGWLSACAVAGQRVIEDGLGLRLPLAEAWLIGTATGVLLFFELLFVAGLLGQLNALVAIGLPALMLLVGGIRPWRRWARAVARASGRTRMTPLELGAAGFGVIALAMIYLTVCTPENIGFDAQWYHLPVAEHFAAAHRIRPFSEGWYLGAYPHLTSVLYAWAFLLPGTQVFDRVLISAHLEWFLFLVTLAAVPLLVRRLVQAPPRSTWALLFLFPSVFLYDGGLFGGADHVLAFWVIPVYLALLRVEGELAARRVLLLVLMLSGAILTKYQAMYVLLPVGARLLWTAWSRRRSRMGWAGRWLAAPGLALMAGLALTSPHWLANVIWYGDPFFPALHRHVHEHPWTADTDANLAVFYQAALWQPQGSWIDKALATARALFTFSFEPHDWPTYHGAVPVFGSLFTVLSLLTPFLRGVRRINHLTLSTLSGVALWFLTSHQDRYLQCLLPWMVAVSAAVLVTAARQLAHLRWPLAALLGVQMAWGADVYFIPAKDNSYENDRPSPIKAAIDLASSGYRHEYASRLHRFFSPWEEIGNSLPASAKVLVHERYLHLGLGRQAVSDIPGWQSGISYAQWGTPSAIYDALRAWGVTHVVWETGRSHESDSAAGDLAFLGFVRSSSVAPARFGAFSILALGSWHPSANSDARAERVAWFDCPAGAGQLFTMRALAQGEQGSTRLRSTSGWRRRVGPAGWCSTAPVARPCRPRSASRCSRVARMRFTRHGTGEARIPLQAVLLELLVQRGDRDAQCLGRLNLVAVGLHHGLPDRGALQGRQRLTTERQTFDVRKFLVVGIDQAKVLWLQHAAVSKGHGARHRVFQLAHVARPVVRAQDIERGLGDRELGAAEIFEQPVHE